MSTESPNRDEDKFNPAVDAEELTTLEEVFDGLEIPAPAPVLGEDGSVVASGFAPGSASGYDAGSTAASGAEAGPTARSAPGSDAGPAREPAVEPVAGPASGPAPGSAAGPVAPKPTSGPATKPTPRAARAASRAVPGTASGPAREPGPSTRRPSSTAASSGPARTAGAAARTPAASGSAPEASTPPEAEAYPAFPSSTPRAGRHARTDGRSAASAASAASSASATSSTSAASSASAASSDDAADLSEAPGRSGQTTAVRRRSLFARTSADDAGTPRPTDQALPADRPGPTRAAAASAPSAPDTARARSEAAAPESAEPAQERAGKPDGGTTGTPAKEAETPAWLTREAARAQRRSSRRSRQRSDDDILLDGSTIVGRPASRAGAHWAGVLMSLVLLPAAWFFVHGAADVLTSTVEPHRFAFNPKAIFELVAGLLTMGVALWTACRSSLGSIVVGALSAVLGLLFLLLPTPMNGLVGPVLDRLTAQSTLGADLAAYFWTDAYSGKFVVLGLFMVMVGVVSHSARRAGRREQEIIDRGRRF